MKFVLDVNVILSALIRDSTTRKIVLESGLDFYFPEASLRKIEKYKNYIIRKSGLSELKYLLVLNALFTSIRVIQTKDVLNKWDQAKRIMEHIDQEDVAFIATALSLADSTIWSDDSDFEKQNKVKVLKTGDIVKLLESKV